MPRVGSEMSLASAGSEATNTREYRVRKSSLIGMINWTHVLLSHAPHLLILGMIILIGQVVQQVVTELFGESEVQWFSYETASVVALAIKELFVRLYLAIYDSEGFYVFSPEVKTTALLLILGAWIVRRDNPVYLMGFATFKAPDSWKCDHDQILEMMRRQECFNDESIGFMKRILERSGTGPATAWPPGIKQSLDSHAPKADRSMDASRKEAETVIFDCVANALEKANVKPKDIDILVINCSLFAPTPSLCAMVVAHFGMRPDVATYNLSGMGCSASLISVDLAKRLLDKRLGKALVVSTEIITPNLYHGNDRGFLIQNTLFRCGGAAIVLSNNWLDGRRAWYKLLHTVRVQSSGEAGYECVFEGEDKTGERGVRLSKDIVKVAGKTMEKNLTTLGPQVLPLSEQIHVVWSLLIRFIMKKFGKSHKPYVPDFKRCIDHFCIHAGGRAVIDGIEKNMKLEKFHSEASRMTLYNYGNTSSSSIWYELEYIQEEQKSNPLKKGDRIMQVAFGSGFKCTSGVWLKL